MTWNGREVGLDEESVICSALVIWYVYSKAQEQVAVCTIIMNILLRFSI